MNALNQVDLVKITVDDKNPVYYDDGNCIIETDTKTLIIGCKTSKIPSDGNVICIGEKAFSCCRNLTSIDIPNSVTNIGQNAFEKCHRLTSINFQGTKAEWDAIEKDENWDSDTGSYTVHCTDGDIPKSES